MIARMRALHNEEKAKTFTNRFGLLVKEFLLRSLALRTTIEPLAGDRQHTARPRKMQPKILASNRKLHCAMRETIAKARPGRGRRQAQGRAGP